MFPQIAYSTIFPYFCRTISTKMRLRKHIRVLHITAGILLLSAMWTASGCKREKTTAADGKGDTVGAVDNSDSKALFATDSVRLSVKDAAGSAEVYIDYPKGNSLAAQEAKSFIRKQLFGDKPVKTADNAEDVARKYCDLVIQNFKSSLEQVNMTGVNKENAPEEGVEIDLVYQSDKVITYESTHYAYFTGGGHGTYGTQGITIRIADGKRMNRIIGDERGVMGLVKEGLMTYFGVNDEAALADYCTVPLDVLPLPANPPYLLEDGVRFQYNVYDICRFDDGDPWFTIPYDSILPYLTEEAKEVIVGS